MSKPAKILPTKDAPEELYILTLSAQGVAITLAALKHLIDSEGHMMTTAENNAVLDMVDELKAGLGNKPLVKEEDA